MSATHTADGRRRSSMTHAKRPHPCDLCGKIVYGNGGKVSHGRSHVRRGEALELLKEYPTWPPLSTRAFLAPNNPLVTRWLADGFRIMTDPT